MTGKHPRLSVGTVKGFVLGVREKTDSKVAKELHVGSGSHEVEVTCPSAISKRMGESSQSEENIIQNLNSHMQCP